MPRTPSPLVHPTTNSRTRRLDPVAGLAALLFAAWLVPHSASAQPAAATDTPAAKARPKVGLVLSGGGARGLTHIGVLKVLHEMRVPIDYIAATSMGAIVGGLYASGMAPDEMQRQLGAVSWPTLLSDSPPRRDVGFRRKEEESLFPMGFEMGYRDGEFLWFKGALSGSNLELFLHELTRKVESIEDFDRLPIPYRAVATNMVTGKEVVFDRGRLYQAMRASMSVPGMFAPFELDGRILGDGGLVNNLPVDVVRAMGADIVIAVNIGTPLMSRDQLQSVVGYASQMINILTEQNVRAQLAQLRPGRHPDLARPGQPVVHRLRGGAEVRATGHPGGRGDAAAARRARRRVAAVRAVREALHRATAAAAGEARLRVGRRARSTRTRRRSRTRCRRGPTSPSHVDARGRPRATLRPRRTRADRLPVRRRSGSRQGLVINVTEKSWGPNFLRFGLSLSSDLQGETFFNLMAGHKRVWINSYGAEWTNEVILGSTRRYATEFYQPLTRGNAVFASAYGLAQRAPEFIFDGSTRSAEYDVLTETAGADLGIPFGTTGELRAGVKWLHRRGDPTIASPFNPDAFTPSFTIKTSETGARVLFRWDSLDNPYFPRNGLRVNAEGFFGDRTTTLPGCPYGVCEFEAESSSRAGLFANTAYPLSKNGFLNVAVQAGGITKTRTVDPISDFNLGGFLQLSGLRTDQLSGDYLGFARAVYYHQIGNLPLLGRGVYVGGSLEAGNTWATRDDIAFKGMYTAGSVFVAADTWIGPFYFAWGRASGGSSSFYIFLGRL